MNGESEERFRLITENAPVMLWMGDAQGKCLYLNRAQRAFWNAPEDVSGFDWTGTVYPDDRAKLYQPFGIAMRDHTPFSVEARYWRADGALRVLHTDAHPRFDGQGRFQGMIGVNVDVTDTRATEAELKQRVAEAVAETRTAQAQLFQSQKMEALGQLVGGVAHDFNNMLAIIAGNAQALLRHLPEGAERPRKAAANIQQGVDRAARLIDRLLSFSRHRPLQVEPCAVNDLVAGMADILARTLGHGVRLDLRPGAGLWPVAVDPNQLENALLNLAINARDAMPGGGTLTIETGNADLGAAGPHVMVRVADTGTGIPAEVQSRVFEPFFTTKQAGSGTGLGLSQVYGFVRQSGGRLHLDSQVGQGTAITIHLPRQAA